MPRAARKKGEYGYYHLTMRGVGKQIIFEERGDYIHFLNLLKRFGLDTNVRICAFCLMENHVHLLIYDPEDHLSLFMQKLGGGYSWYFNYKYERTGHLFQDRFGSVPIESEERLLTVLRYILNNPREAGICRASEYEWSSYSRYGDPNSFVDTLVLQELLGSFEEYDKFINAKDEEQGEYGQFPMSLSGTVRTVPGVPGPGHTRTVPIVPREPAPLSHKKHDDEWAKTVIREALNGQTGTVLRTYDWQKRNEILKELKEKGLSVRQIERLTGISKSVVQRA